MPKAMHSKQRARIAKRKQKGMTEKAENDNRAARNHERAIMDMLVRRKHPKHGGLDSARVDDIAKALETPDPLQSTPEEIEADLQRRGAAMEEINAPRPAEERYRNATGAQAPNGRPSSPYNV
ncbi:MAG: hypothetical protein Q9195_006216 [Heterodermia aff. obscurata]